MAALIARGQDHPWVRLGDHLPAVESAVTCLRKHSIIERIWRRDHTVWGPDPTEITNRLGWLTVTDVMRGQISDLRSFANEIRLDGFKQVVLLGMGGSSLGPEVLRQVFGKADGYPELIVLDSTVPSCVRAVADNIDPAHTLFLVSSKSGTTLETLSFYRYFRDLVESATRKETAGENFVAITDRGTPLGALAQEAGFRRSFLNPSDIGGRYSILSYFGLVPAALIGVNLATLLDRADQMRGACSPSVAIPKNPGAWLGVVMGTLAKHGRNKLTLITSPSLMSLELWIEQMIAESTGKDGEGILPIAGELPVDPICYGDDRQFIYTRLKEDNNARTDAISERIEQAGQSVVRLNLRDRYDLAAEFYRWEFAVAVAGTILGINPFNQPSVQQSKNQTARLLDELGSSGLVSPGSPCDSLEAILKMARHGDYLAIMAYIGQSQAIDQALARIRQVVTEKCRIATTSGYGPRLLHSTGQIHKGGPGNGLFLQLTSAHADDTPIPGTNYTFGALADTQALVDLESLLATGRRVAKISLGPDHASNIETLFDEVLYCSDER